jgi:hypothetical protein
MNVPVKKINIGIQMLDGTARIIEHHFPMDMGDHGRVSMLKNIEAFSPFFGMIKAVFSYCNIKNGNCIYREVLEHGDYKEGEFAKQ